jgi:hypothetical protein
LRINWDFNQNDKKNLTAHPKNLGAHHEFCISLFKRSLFFFPHLGIFLKASSFIHCKKAWASAGEGKGALAPPPSWPAKNGLFLDFFWGKLYLFVVFCQKLGSFPTGKFLPSPRKKSADGHGEIIYLVWNFKRMFLAGLWVEHAELISNFESTNSKKATTFIFS